MHGREQASPHPQAERQGVPEPNKPGEQPWRPVLPKDLPKVEAFINELSQNKEQLRSQLRNYLQKPDITMDDVIWADYLNLSVNLLVLDSDPFADQSPQQRRVSRLLANMATQHVADLWLDKHPTSGVAKVIAERGIDAPALIHKAFLYEIWPSFGPKIDRDRSY